MNKKIILISVMFLLVVPFIYAADIYYDTFDTSLNSTYWHYQNGTGTVSLSDGKLWVNGTGGDWNTYAFLGDVAHCKSNGTSICNITVVWGKEDANTNQQEWGVGSNGSVRFYSRSKSSHLNYATGWQRLFYESNLQRNLFTDNTSTVNIVYDQDGIDIYNNDVLVENRTVDISAEDMQFGIINYDGSFYLDSIEINNNSLSNVTYTLGNCSDFSTKAIEFFFKDETTGNTMTAYADTTIYYLNQAGEQSLGLDINNLENFSVCVNPSYANISADFEITYSSENGSTYPQRVYTFEDYILDNQSNSVNLYLLNGSEGNYFYIKVVDGYTNPIEGALVNIQKMLNGSYKTVQSINTTSSGVADFFLDFDDIYKIIVTKDGYDSFTGYERPTAIDYYTITLGGTVTEEEFPLTYGITHFFEPSGIVLNNDTTYNFTFNVSSSYWEIKDCMFNIKNDTQYFSELDHTNWNTSHCYMQIDFNTIRQNKLTVEGRVIVNDSQNITFVTEYSVRNTYEGQFSLMTFFDDVSEFGESGFNDFTRIMISFIIILGAVGIVSMNGTGVYGAEPIIILSWILVIFFSYVGWMTINYDAIPNEWLQQYLISLLYSIPTIAYIINKHAG